MRQQGERRRCAPPRVSPFSKLKCPGVLSGCPSVHCGCCPANSFSFCLPSSSLACGCCPARAVGRLPGAGHGVRGVPPLHPLHPRTPLCAGTRNLSLELGCTPSAACRVGHRREPSPACGRGDVRACCGAPSALRAHGIAFAPAPSLHQRRGRKGKLCRAAVLSENDGQGWAGRRLQRETGGREMGRKAVTAEKSAGEPGRAEAGAGKHKADSN